MAATAQDLLEFLGVPTSAIPKLRAAFGGTTNGETIAAIRAWVRPRLYHYVKESLCATRRATDEATVAANQAAEAADIEANWPVA